MQEESLLPSIRQLAFLLGASDGLIDGLSALAERVRVPYGERVFRQGEPARHVYWILQGRVALEIGAPSLAPRRILTIGAGELLGWSALIEPTGWTATARALDDTDLIRLPAEELLAWCDAHPTHGYALMRRVANALAKRLSATRLQYLDVYGAQLPTVTASASTHKPSTPGRSSG